MSVVFYAQNFEDFMLWRALKDIKNGFYIDVGANDPAEHSVTKVFYDNGWSGINIEPLAIHYADLKRERPRDINLQIAIGADNGELEIWESEKGGWSTLDTHVVTLHEASGYKGTWNKVPVKTLTSVFDEYELKDKDIHFLKIDVEGFEYQVLQGMDFTIYRPWVVVLEVIVPHENSNLLDIDCEKLLKEKNYLFAYADGLNKFYVAKEQDILLPLFKYPPNTFDEPSLLLSSVHYVALNKAFVELTAVSGETSVALKKVEAELEQINLGFMDTQAKLNDTQAELNDTQAELNHMYTSHSWRITKPLRLMSDFVRWSMPRAKAWLTFAPQSRPRRMARNFVKKLVIFINSKPELKIFLHKFIDKLPNFMKTKFINAWRTEIVELESVMVLESKLILTPRESTIYKKLLLTQNIRKEDEDAHSN